MVPLTTVSPKCLHGRVVKTSELKRWFEPPWTEISIFLHTNLYFYMQTCTFAYKRTDFCVQIYTPTYKNYTFTYEPTHLPFIYKLDFFLQINKTLLTKLKQAKRNKRSPLHNFSCIQDFHSQVALKYYWERRR